MKIKINLQPLRLICQKCVRKHKGAIKMHMTVLKMYTKINLFKKLHWTCESVWWQIHANFKSFLNTNLRPVFQFSFSGNVTEHSCLTHYVHSVHNILQGKLHLVLLCAQQFTHLLCVHWFSFLSVEEKFRWKYSMLLQLLTKTKWYQGSISTINSY